MIVNDQREMKYLLEEIVTSREIISRQPPELIVEKHDTDFSRASMPDQKTLIVLKPR